MQQFLIESVLVCLIGGMIGIILSYGVGFIFSLFVKSFAMKFSFVSIISAFLCSTIIGVFRPPETRQGLDPIEALARSSGLQGLKKNIPKAGIQAARNRMPDQVLYDAEALSDFCETINFCGAFPKSDPQEAHLTENKT